MMGAGTIFFAYIGFDAVSTAAQEANNPQKDMPIGIIGSLAVCTVLYIAFALVLTGLVPYMELGTAAPVATAIDKAMPQLVWMNNLVKFGIICGYTSVILVMLLGQSRVFYSMSRDGLVPPVFSEIHPKFQTPWRSNMLFFFFVAPFSAFLPLSIVGHMTSIGTLFAFVIVCAGVGDAGEEPRRPAAVQDATGTAGAHSRHRLELRDDVLARLVELAAADRLAGDRSGDLLRLWPRPQPLATKRP